MDKGKSKKGKEVSDDVRKSIKADKSKKLNSNQIVRK